MSLDSRRVSPPPAALGESNAAGDSPSWQDLDSAHPCVRDKSEIRVKYNSVQGLRRLSGRRCAIAGRS